MPQPFTAREDDLILQHQAVLHLGALRVFGSVGPLTGALRCHWAYFAKSEHFRNMSEWVDLPTLATAHAYWTENWGKASDEQRMAVLNECSQMLLLNKKVSPPR